MLYHLFPPQLYRVGILRKEWNQTKFLWYMLDGTYQSVICDFFPFLFYHKTMYVNQNVLGSDHRFYFGTIVLGICVLSCNLHIFMQQYRWDWFCGMFIGISLVFYFGWAGI